MIANTMKIGIEENFNEQKVTELKTKMIRYGNFLFEK